MPENNNSHICIIKSEIRSLITVESFLFDFFKFNYIADEFFPKIFLCLSEVVVNSIFHGNNGDLNKSIVIRLRKKGHRLFVSVKDEGNGFNIHEIDDPTKIENIKREFGRGIHIIKSLSDSIYYKKNQCFLRFSI